MLFHSSSFVSQRPQRTRGPSAISPHPNGLDSADQEKDKARSTSKTAVPNSLNLLLAHLNRRAGTFPSPRSSGRIDIDTFGTLSEYTVLCTGTSLEVEFDEFSKPMKLRIPANAYTIGPANAFGIRWGSELREGDMLEVEPRQMHMHTFSEHTFNGMYAAGELHIVTRVKKGESEYCDSTDDGCLAVFGIMMEFSGDGDHSNPALASLFDIMPEETGAENGVTHFGKLSLDAFLPRSRDYYTYLGSLTTPPCSEIVTWHVFTDPIKISTDLMLKHQWMVSTLPGQDCEAVHDGACYPPREKTNDRVIQPRNGRDVFLVREYFRDDDDDDSDGYVRISV